jgi:hypothetical protein
METEIAKAVRILVGELNKDPGYRNAWQANIAMAFYDTFRNSEYGSDVPHEDIHEIANRAAASFLMNLCRVES